MNSIPLELVHEIFSSLPLKSIARCRCVSKQWRSILCSAAFTELFLTKSSTRPSLLFAMQRSRNTEFLFFSSHQNDNSSTLAACAHFKLSKDIPLELCGHASGLFCFRRMPTVSTEDKEEYTDHLVCHPSTGQQGFLPKVRTGSRSLLGFDPIDKVFKVVSSTSTYSSCSNVHNVFTLGTGEVKWRKIKSPLALYPDPRSRGICIDGVLYYLAQERDRNFILACFDVRSEKFKFMSAHFFDSGLSNYEGTLGLFRWLRVGSMTLRVLEDAEKHHWSEHQLTFDKFSDVVGVTATGEIVLMNQHSNPVYVFYFHPERNTVKRLEVQGFENRGGSTVYASVDHVDDFTFDMKSWQLHQDVPPRFESFNKFRALSLLDDV